METVAHFRYSRAATARGTFSLKKTSAGLLLAGLLAAAMPPAFGGAEFKIGDDAGLTAGIGLRMSYSKMENGAPNGTSNSNDFNVDNTRLFFTGHYGNIIKGTFNVDRTGASSSAAGDGLRVLDAIAQFEFNDVFNIWMGRMLPPQDRANGYGPFYALPWSYPLVVSNYPQIENGRDNGVTVWGKPFGGHLVYSVGAFEGHNKDGAGYSGASDKLAYSGRLVWHIWDPEPAPAYLAGGWFGGSKDLLSVGLGAYTQADGVGSAARPGRLRVWNTDVLFEKKFGSFVPTLEGAYYKYKLGAVDCGSAEPGAPATPTCLAPAASARQVMEDGKAYLLSAGVLFTEKFGWGQFQPYVRYQKFERTLSNTTNKQTDFGLNYIIKGPNAKVVAQYSKMEDSRRPAPANDLWQFVLGVQLVY